MSIALRAVSGALWSISTSVGARVIGLVGTLLLTRFLSEAQFGEVAVAQVVVLTVSIFTGLGLGQYIVAHPKAARANIFHASALYTAIGLVTLLAAVALRDPLGVWLGAPGMREFLPGLAVSVALERLAFMPERVLVREMRFRVVSIERSSASSPTRRARWALPRRAGAACRWSWAAWRAAYCARPSACGWCRAATGPRCIPSA